MSTNIRLFYPVLLASAFTFGAFAAQAETFGILHTFTGAPDGAYPVYNELTLDKGKLYSTTPNGGDADAGVVFQLTTQGKEKVLYTFTGGTDGANPNGGVLRDPATGNIYGTAAAGGDAGNGVLFRLKKNGAYTVLHNFDGTDGQAPIGSLVRDEAGNLFGVAMAGGETSAGTVFEWTAGGEFHVVHEFNGNDGAGPSATLTRDSSGNLYGVTQFGGDDGFGNIFKIASDGTFTTLYSFTGGNDGGNPQGGLARDAEGNLYGTATYDGAHGKGIVYRLKPNGKFSLLYTFLGADDGQYPTGDLLRTDTGDLYGTTSYGGGSPGNGTAWRLSTKGKFALLHSFGGGEADGAYPHAGLIQAGRDKYYGIAHSGGGGAGIVYSLTK
ncbi:MAG: hypothetical protein JO056_10215 [Alphaproteobacteria bacterium]|nr:hypothetical protein [Alphaproteobacteria bacterium]